MEKVRRSILWKKSGDYFAGNVQCNTYFTFSGRCGASTSDVQLKTAHNSTTRTASSLSLRRSAPLNDGFDWSAFVLLI